MEQQRRNSQFLGRIGGKITHEPRILIPDHFNTASASWGCLDKSVSGYIPASSFSKKGFAKNREQALANRSKVIKIWGYVDVDNVFSKEWEDDSPEKWRFDLNL